MKLWEAKISFSTDATNLTDEQLGEICDFLEKNSVKFEIGAENLAEDVSNLFGISITPTFQS